jgi:hypothetical protein
VEIPPVVAEIIGLAIAVRINACKVVEVEPFFDKPDFGNIGFSSRVQFSQYPVIPFQNIVDAPHKAAGFAVEPVVVIVAALVGTKLLVAAPVQHFTTILTGSLLVHIGLVFFANIILLLKCSETLGNNYLKVTQNYMAF